MKTPMVTSRLHRTAALVVLCVESLVATPASALITLLDTQGFEPSLFSTTFDDGGAGYAGQLEGQPQPDNTWQQAGPDASTATVQTAVVESGTQAVALQYGGADTRWGVPMSLANPLSVTISFDLAYTASSPATVPGVGPFGPLYGVEAYDASGITTNLLGSVFVDTSNGELVYQVPGTGNVTGVPGFVLDPVGAAGDNWYAIDLVLDYIAQEYSIFVDGVLALGGIDFVDGLSTTFTDAPLAAISGGVDPRSPGAGFVDNFVITAEVPEFSTGIIWAGLGSIVGGASWWKRRRAAA